MMRKPREQRDNETPSERRARHEAIKARAQRALDAAARFLLPAMSAPAPASGRISDNPYEL